MAAVTLISQLVKRCQADPIFFINNFCKVKHPKAMVIPLKLFDYQRNSIRNFLKHRFTLYKKCRQCGISTVTGVFSLWYAMFHPYKTVLIVSKRDDDAKDFLAKNVKFPYDNLPDELKQIWGNPPSTYNEHQVIYPNGSSIRSLTSSPDTLRSYAASLNILDEVAFMPDMDAMWSGGAPTVMQGGSVIAISTCVASNTLLFTNNGIIRIGDVVDTFTKYDDDYDIAHTDINVSTDEGLMTTSALYRHKPSSAIKVRTKYRTELIGDRKHVVQIYSECDGIIWKNLDQLRLGDYLTVVSGSNVWGNNNDVNFGDGPFKIQKIDEKLARKLGLILADGYINDNYIVFTSADKELQNEFLSDSMLTWIPERDGLHFRSNSRYMVRFLRWLGFNREKAALKVIPKRILKCSKKIIAAFISGMFDGDGFSRTRDGSIGYVSTSYEMIRDLKVILLNFGIFSRIEEKNECEREFPSHNGHYISKCQKSYILIMQGDNARRFYKEISFGLSRKQKNQSKLPPISYILTPPIAGIIRQWMRDNHISIEKLKKTSRVSANKLLFEGTGRIYNRVLSRFLMKFPHATHGQYKLLKYISRDDIRFEEVIKLEDAGIIETYDFTVPVKNSLLTNGVVSHNSNGIGDWYHQTWMDAIEGKNEFHPIEVNWWDMKWTINYRDELTSKIEEISPTKNIRKCETKEEKEKWGLYYSPWLEEQYRILQRKGEAHKFRQEILAEFLGAGDPVLPHERLVHISSTINDNYQVVKGVDYIHPVTGEGLKLDFEGQLWVWKKPVKAELPTLENGRIIKLGKPGHAYCMGVDISSGEADDFSAIEIVDCNSMEQVAELNIKVLPQVLIYMADYLARWYNNAFIVPDRTGMGIPVCQAFYNEMSYANLYRLKMPSGKLSKKVGFPITGIYKPMLNKCLLDSLGHDEGIIIYSRRLYQQLTIYVYLGNNKTGNVKGTGNHDDLTIGMGLALLGVPDMIQNQTIALVPTRINDQGPEPPPLVNPVQQLSNFASQGGMGALVPYVGVPELDTTMTPDEELQRFARQLGGIPADSKQAGQAAFLRQSIRKP
jgi:intein/homing endonuclease